MEGISERYSEIFRDFQGFSEVLNGCVENIEHFCACEGNSLQIVEFNGGGGG